MARTNHADVVAAIDTSLSMAQVEAFIDDANAWVTDFLGGEGLSAARLKIIEKYLACHYVSLRDPRVKSGSIGDSSEVYQRATQVTEYLKQAIAEDPTGIVRGRLLDQEDSVPVRFKVGVYAPGDG